jgi:TolB-like protein/Flp pilus assembly protein TadD
MPAPAARSRAPRIAAALTLAAVVAAAIYSFVRWERPAEASSRALAVLPFENLTGDKEQGYIVDGFTDGLTTNLAQNRRLQVASRSAAFRYRDTQKPAPQIGKELGVTTIVLGSVVRTGDRLRVSAQLVDTATDRHVWAHNYDGTLDDMIKLQDTVAAEIVRAIGLDSRSMALQALSRRPVDRQAYLDYLHAINVEGRGGFEGFRDAIPLLNSAIARQPDFALAYAELAYVEQQLLFTSPLPPREVAPKAEEAARKAIALDDTLARPHRVLGGILHDYYWNSAEGKRENQRALALEPNAPETGVNEVTRLLRAGKYDDALIAADRVRQISTDSGNVMINIAVAFRGARQYDRAIAILRKAIETDPKGSRTHFQLALTYLDMGKTDEAVGELEETLNHAPGNARFQAYLGWAYAKTGRRAEARRILAELEARAHTQYVSSFGLAMIHDALGEKQAALTAIERAYEDHAVELAALGAYPPFETLKGDPRFDAIVRAVSGH